jgi:hypothetical protein
MSGFSGKRASVRMRGLELAIAKLESTLVVGLPPDPTKPAAKIIEHEIVSSQDGTIDGE